MFSNAYSRAAPSLAINAFLHEMGNNGFLARMQLPSRQLTFWSIAVAAATILTAASDTKETKFTKVENEIYDVVFAQPGSLGIVFNGDLSVSDVLKTSISRAHKYVKPGDTLVGVNGESVENIELSDVAQLVKYNGKPRTLRFWRPGA